MSTAAITLAIAQTLLYGDAKAPDCSKATDQVACLIDARFAADKKAQALAAQLYRDTGDVAGLGAEEIMDGGYRGKIHLVPQLPVDGYRKHLGWVVAAMTSIEAFTRSSSMANRRPRIAGATSRFGSCARSASARRVRTR